ncbi:type II toxin-antitoxin system RelE/ParE family toxin [Sphingomonas sp.]|uniref:type II toxin-antitoxin system RelE/ParE family toxin n=1 Tax=Sphingomonas sp. TaxID=28214 RepID=UPI0035BC1086
MHTVVETSAYLRAAKLAGIEEGEQQAIVDMIAANPEAGEIMPGCGGARKLRVARPGGGKSGGYRAVTYFGGKNTPVFLLTIFPKNVKTNLTKAEQNAFADVCKRLTGRLGAS